MVGNYLFPFFPAWSLPLLLIIIIRSDWATSLKWSDRGAPLLAWCWIFRLLVRGERGESDWGLTQTYQLEEAVWIEHTLKRSVFLTFVGNSFMRWYKNHHWEAKMNPTFFSRTFLIIFEASWVTGMTTNQFSCIEINLTELKLKPSVSCDLQR